MLQHAKSEQTNLQQTGFRTQLLIAAMLAVFASGMASIARANSNADSVVCRELFVATKAKVARTPAEPADIGERAGGVVLPPAGFGSLPQMHQMHVDQMRFFSTHLEQQVQKLSRYHFFSGFFRPGILPLSKKIQLRIKIMKSVQQQIDIWISKNAQGNEKQDLQDEISLVYLTIHFLEVTSPNWFDELRYTWELAGAGPKVVDSLLNANHQSNSEFLQYYRDSVIDPKLKRDFETSFEIIRKMIEFKSSWKLWLTPQSLSEADVVWLNANRLAPVWIRSDEANVDGRFRDPLEILIHDLVHFQRQMGIFEETNEDQQQHAEKSLLFIENRLSRMLNIRRDWVAVGLGFIETHELNISNAKNNEPLEESFLKRRFGYPDMNAAVFKMYRKATGNNLNKFIEEILELRKQLQGP